MTQVNIYSIPHQPHTTLPNVSQSPHRKRKEKKKKNATTSTSLCTPNRVQSQVPEFSQTSRPVRRRLRARTPSEPCTIYSCRMCGKRTIASDPEREESLHWHPLSEPQSLTRISRSEEPKVPRPGFVDLERGFVPPLDASISSSVDLKTSPSAPPPQRPKHSFSALRLCLCNLCGLALFWGEGGGQERR